MCLVLIVVMLVAAHGSVAVEPRHRPGPWFGVATFVPCLVVVIAVGAAARAVGLRWDNTVMAATIVVVFAAISVLWRRLAFRAAARERDSA